MQAFRTSPEVSRREMPNFFIEMFHYLYHFGAWKHLAFPHFLQHCAFISEMELQSEPEAKKLPPIILGPGSTLKTWEVCAPPKEGEKEKKKEEKKE